MYCPTKAQQETRRGRPAELQTHFQTSRGRMLLLGTKFSRRTAGRIDEGGDAALGRFHFLVGVGDLGSGFGDLRSSWSFVRASPLPNVPQPHLSHSVANHPARPTTVVTFRIPWSWRSSGRRPVLHERRGEHPHEEFLAAGQSVLGLWSTRLRPASLQQRRSVTMTGMTAKLAARW